MAVVTSRPDTGPPELRAQNEAVNRERRVEPRLYLLAVAVVLIIGLALVAFGTLRFAQSTDSIERDGAPANQLLVPDHTEGATPQGSPPEKLPEPTTPEPGAIDVPGSN